MFDPIMERENPDQKLFVSAGSDITIPIWKRHIFVTGASGSTTTVRLPNVSEAEGLEFIISGYTAAAASSALIALKYQNGGLGAFSTSIVTSGTEVAFRSTGLVWQIVRS